LEGTADPVDCPKGYYCEDYCAKPVPCPLGTYRATVGAASVDDCTLCDPGHACGQTALIAPDLDCDPGYFCILGCSSSQPIGATKDDTEGGGLCPEGVIISFSFFYSKRLIVVPRQ
jgi:hypothetical protein